MQAMLNCGRGLALIDDGGQRSWRIRTFLLHLAMLTAPLVLALVHTRFQVDPLGICLFRTVVGIDCPACGITRSAMALFSGHMREAFHLHPAGPIIVGILGVTTSYLALVLLSGGAGFEWGKEAAAFKSIERLAVAALLIGWVVRLSVN